MLSNRFIKDPHEVVKAGETVKVKVLEVDLNRKRIALTMRLDDATPRPGTAGAQPAPRRDERGTPRQQQSRAPEPRGNGLMAEALARALKR
jgi:uncharacterized protein